MKITIIFLWILINVLFVGLNYLMCILWGTLWNMVNVKIVSIDAGYVAKNEQWLLTRNSFVSGVATTIKQITNH